LRAASIDNLILWSFTTKNEGPGIASAWGRVYRPTRRRYAVDCPILLRAVENAKMRRCERHCYVEGMKGVRIRRVPLNMSRKHPECCNPLDQSVVADLTLRQEPDEEEEKTKRKTKTTALKTMTVTEKTTATRSRVLAQSRDAAILRLGSW